MTTLHYFSNIALFWFGIALPGTNFWDKSEHEETDHLQISPELYWLGFSRENEKEFGCKNEPSKLPLMIDVHLKDSAEMTYLSAICGVKFKRNKHEKECSNCEDWFTSNKVDRAWVQGKYFEYSRSRYDSTSNLQWYVPRFRSEFLLEAEKFEQLSFIGGLFLSSGTVDSSGLAMMITESPQKAHCTVELLKLLDCTNIAVETEENVLSGGVLITQRTDIFFTPSLSVRSFLKNEIEIRQGRR